MSRYGIGGKLYIPKFTLTARTAYEDFPEISNDQALANGRYRYEGYLMKYLTHITPAKTFPNDWPE